MDGKSPKAMAEKCRRLGKSVGDEQTCKTLYAMADEYDAQHDAAEAALLKSAAPPEDGG